VLTPGEKTLIVSPSKLPESTLMVNWGLRCCFQKKFGNPAMTDMLLLLALPSFPPRSANAQNAAASDDLIVSALDKVNQLAPYQLARDFSSIGRLVRRVGLCM
jgi:hypothetical protein